MKTIMCSIYDKATEAYMRPFTALSVGQAVRMFEDDTQNTESPINKHPEDYTLFQIGTFNDSNGELETMVPKPLRNAHEVKKLGESNAS